ncbi:MAG: hypothetical protein JWN96_3693, partial [Mycobacterium sp.]|nr:hypothetical protein [Mycobacterium sp.]
DPTKLSGSWSRPTSSLQSRIRYPPGVLNPSVIESPSGMTTLTVLVGAATLNGPEVATGWQLTRPAQTPLATTNASHVSRPLPKPGVEDERVKIITARITSALTENYSKRSNPPSPNERSERTVTLQVATASRSCGRLGTARCRPSASPAGPAGSRRSSAARACGRSSSRKCPQAPWAPPRLPPRH